jgi:PAS domain S-box-containing protein
MNKELYIYIMPIKPFSKTNEISESASGRRYQERRIAETIKNGFFKVDRRWMVEYWNKAAEKLSGIRARGIVGKNLWEVLSEIVPLSFYKSYHHALLQDIPGHFEIYWAEKGARFDVITYLAEDTLSVSFKCSDQRSQPEQQVNTKQKLRALNELYRFVTEITNDCLWEWDLQTREIFWIDGGHKRVFGYPIENALIPQNFWEDHLHPDDRARVLKGLERAIKEGAGRIWEDEYRFAKINGEYAYVHDRGHIVYEGNGNAVRMIGATQDITARKSIETRLLETERQLVWKSLTSQKEITAAVLMAQEKERANIGRELHDNLNQILGAAKLYIELAKTDEENRQMCLDKSTGYIVQVIEEIRRISKTLAAPAMKLMGLIDSIQIMVDDLILVNPLKIGFHPEGFSNEELHERLQLDIFRMVQEQLNNILRHAEATEVTIRLTRQGNEIILLITDNGKGCDMLKEMNGMGMINIKTRAELYHGRVTIVSTPGNGYSLKAELSIIV